MRRKIADMPYLYKQLILIVLLFGVIFCLAGCTSSGVSQRQLISDLQQSDIFSPHNTEIDELTIIKRKTDKEEDVVYVNVKGVNDVYSLSLNFKMTYLLYNDGWRLETTDGYYDDAEFLNEIMPLTGPSQEVIDNFTSQQDWKSVASFAGWLERDVEWTIVPTDDLSLDRFYGQAKYMCTVVCEYPYVVETVSFPAYFYFSSVQDSNYAWQAYSDENVLSETERSVELKPTICQNWVYENTFSNEFRSTYVKSVISMKEIVASSNGMKDLVAVDSYYFYDASEDETYEANGKMRLVPFFDQETGKISSLKLKWVGTSSKNLPKQCADLSFNGAYYTPGNALHSDYRYYFGIFDYPLLYTAQE